MCDKDIEYIIIYFYYLRIKVFEKKYERGKINVILNDKTIQKMIDTLEKERNDVSEFIHKNPPYLYILDI